MIPLTYLTTADDVMTADDGQDSVLDRPHLAEVLEPWLARVGANFADMASPVVVACSGGTDSLALLAIAAAAGVGPVAVHVDHGIREGSSEEGQHVERVALMLGARFLGIEALVPSGPGLEARARVERYAALECARDELGAEWVLVAHTVDDQAETVLLNLLRGSAAAGLGGMPARRGHLCRPILDLRRSDTAEICDLLDLNPIEDSMNSDVSYRRVWIRKEVLPMLERGADRDLRPVLARQAKVLRAESDYLDDLATGVLAGAGDSPEARALVEAPIVLARRAVRLWLGPPPPSLDEVEGVMEVARGMRRSVNLTGDRWITRSKGLMVLHCRDHSQGCSNG